MVIPFAAVNWHSAATTITLDIPDDLKARIDAVAARSSLTAAEVVADALQNAHSIEWQERFLDQVAKGIEAADNGEFASPAELARIVNKYRSS